MADRTGTEGYVRAAFLNQYNLILMAAAVLFSVLDASPLGVLFGLGLEIAYLAVVPGLAAFQRTVDRKRDEAARAEARVKREALLVQMSVTLRQKFDQLEGLVDRIKANVASQGEAVRMVLEDSLAKADRLLASFVKLAIAHGTYHGYLSATDRRALAREITDLDKAMAHNASARVKEVQEQRLAIARKRAERWDRARENIEVIAHQLATIEELLCLMHEQSIAPKDPQRMSDDLDRFMGDLEGNEGTVRELAEFGADDETELPELAVGRDEGASERAGRGTGR